jgi:Zn-dependent M28 family amino/carboxypeptidase
MKNYDMTKYILSLFLLTLAIASCKNRVEDYDAGIESINADDLKRHIKVLASDDFEGRAPASPGEEKTINYLAEQFGKLGLEPANNGSWFQEVPMIKITAQEDIELNITDGKNRLSLSSPSDFIGGTPQTSDKISVENSEIVFAGYGIIAPEYNWNDYADLDVKGKTVVVLVNDPGYATGDTALFTGKSMTYYGRWTYKYEEAARQGATGIIIIHETGAASYPWAVVRNSWTGPQFYLEQNEFLGSDLLLKGWVTNDAAKKLFKVAGVDFEEAVRSAATREFKPLNLKLKASVTFRNEIEHVKSNNVAAIWKGSERADEYIIYTAHWDHLGIISGIDGDSIMNGAVDNATGVAALLEIAEAFTKISRSQLRSVLFLAVTAEEQGLLGSSHYAENPLFPLEKTAAVINMDALNILGRTKDMTIIGHGNSELDKYAVAALEQHGRFAIADPTPEKGSYFRSDHFPFARKGVPALYLSEGIENTEHGREWALKESERWINENYHKPSDNYDPEWNFDGMLDDIKIYFQTGYELSMTSYFPQWSPGFKLR